MNEGASGGRSQRTLQLAGAGFAFFVFLNINILATLAASFVVWATAGALGGAVGLAALTVAVSQMVSLENPAGPVAALALAAIYQKLVLDRSANAILRRIAYVIMCIIFSAILISSIESFQEKNYLIFLFFILIPSLICIGNFIALGLTPELLSRFQGRRRDETPMAQPRFM